MKFPVLAAASAVFAYLAGHAIELFKAMWLPALLLIVSLAAVLPQYFDAAIALSRLSPNAGPQEALAHLAPVLRSAGLLLLIAAVFYPMLVVASLRHIVRGERSARLFYLGYSGDELRALGAYALIFTLIVIAYLVYALGVSVVAAVLRLVSPAAAGVGGLAVGLAGLCALIWFIARLSMVFPAALATKSLGLAQSWRATQGRALSLTGFWFLIGLALLVAGAIYTAALMQPVLDVYGDIARTADPAARQAASIRLLEAQRALYDVGNASFWPFIIGTWIYTMAMMALMNVAAGTAWRFLTDAPPAQG